MIRQRTQRAPTSGSVGRGVWVAQRLGPDGETILVAVRRDGRLLVQRALGPCDDHVEVADALWDRLDEADPVPQLVIVR